MDLSWIFHQSGSLGCLPISAVSLRAPCEQQPHQMSLLTSIRLPQFWSSALGPPQTQRQYTCMRSASSRSSKEFLYQLEQKLFALLDRARKKEGDGFTRLSDLCKVWTLDLDGTTELPKKVCSTNQPPHRPRRSRSRPSKAESPRMRTALMWFDFFICRLEKSRWNTPPHPALSFSSPDLKMFKAYSLLPPPSWLTYAKHLQFKATYPNVRPCRATFCGRVAAWEELT